MDNTATTSRIFQHKEMMLIMLSYKKWRLIPNSGMKIISIEKL